jgi:hypothetical protein
LGDHSVSLEDLKDLVSAADIHVPEGNGDGSVNVIVQDTPRAPVFAQTALTDEDLAQLQLGVAPTAQPNPDDPTPPAEASSDTGSGRGSRPDVVNSDPLVAVTPANLPLDPFAYEGALFTMCRWHSSHCRSQWSCWSAARSPKTTCQRR